MTDKTLNLGRLAAANHDSDLLSRKRLAGLAGLQFDGDRDIYDVAGYEENLLFRHYMDRYRRQDIAGRIVDMPAQATWRNSPDVVQVDADGKRQEDTEFSRAFEQVRRNVRLWHMMERADRLAGIGEYAVLLLGLPGTDGNMDEPIPTDLGEGDLMYLSAFHQGDVDIEAWQTEPTDPRFGLPTIYDIDLGGDVEGFEAASVDVHWTRVIHVADDLLEDEVYGRPRLQRVFNRLYDLEKMTAATAESYWQLAARIFQVTYDPEFGGVDDDLMDDVNEQVEEMIHELRRVVQIKGGEIEVLEGNEPDPSNAADLVIQLISAASGIPKRVLMGSERGELASTQDKSEWLARVSERQTRFAEPAMLRPLIDRLQQSGVLPMAEYEVRWPDLFELSEIEKAETAKNWATAAKNLAPAGMTDQLVTEGEARQFLDLPEERPDEAENEAFRREEDAASIADIREAGG